MTEIRYVKKAHIPAILRPGDFDWARSQVRKPELWQSIRGPSVFGNWRAFEMAWYGAGDPLTHSQPDDRSLAYQHHVELHRADVMKIRCGGETIHDKQVDATRNLQSSGAKARGIAEAIKQLWPDRIPKGLSAKDRNNAIINQLKHNGSSIPKNPERAIQRALKMQQPK
jgi:hypothetical protein